MIHRLLKKNLYSIENEHMVCEPYQYGKVPHFMIVPMAEYATRTQTLYRLLQVLILDNLLSKHCVKNHFLTDIPRDA